MPLPTSVDLDDAALALLRDRDRAPGPLPDEVIEALDADDTDPNVLRAEREHPGLDLSVARWDDVLNAVVIPRAELERVENPLRWEVRASGGEFYVLAYFEDGVTLAAVEPRPAFEGAYIASRPPRRVRAA